MTDHGPHEQHQHHSPAQHTIERPCDVAVIGGSAAGLAAALQLTRQRRSVIVVDDAAPRNAPAAHVHAYLGHEGRTPAELAEIGREEVRSFGGEVLPGRVLAVRPAEEGRFRVELSGGHALLARRVVAATGISDDLPAVQGLAERWGREVIHCPFCHGYEVRDRRLVQVVTHPMNLHPTPLLRHLTDRLTVVVAHGSGVAPDDPALTGLPVVSGTLRRLSTAPDGALAVELDSGEVLPADAVLIGPAFRARADVLVPAGVTTAPHASGLGDVVEVDRTGRTAVPGVFAAGNLTDPGLQVLPAAAHGSLVGAMVAFDLADDDARGPARTHGPQTEWDHRYGAPDRVWSGNPNGSVVHEAAGLTPGRALDVGAGEGADALWLAEQGWTVTASDVSGNALARMSAEAERRGLEVGTLRVDANALDAFGCSGSPDSPDAPRYDLVTLAYGSFHRTPDDRGLRNLLGAVAVGGTLLVVAHDLAPLLAPVSVATQTRMYDHGAYVGVAAIAEALATDPAWRIDVHETRPRPAGAVSTHHVDDVILRATRLE